MEGGAVNRISIAAATVLVIVVAAAVLYLGQRPAGSAAAAATATAPAAAPTAPPSTVAPSRAPVAAMPAAVLGDWHADDVAIPGLTGPQLVRLSLNWDGGKDGWIQFDGDGSGRQVLNFVSLAAPDGKIRVSSNGGAGCSAGQEGSYDWRRSPDGLFLALKVVDDACATRAAAFARTWVHSLTAVTDGGLGVLPDDPWLEIKMPKQRFGASGLGTDASWLHPMSDADPVRYLMLIADPMGFDRPCEASRQTIAIAHTTKAFEQYLGSLPGLTMKSAAATIDGIPGRQIDLVVNKGVECASGDLDLFHSRVPTETDADWTMAPGEAIYLWATVKDGHLRLFGYGGAGVTPDHGHAVIGSMRFLANLPTP